MENTGQDCAALQQMQADLFRDLRNTASACSYGKGDTLYSADQPPEGLFLVYAGRVRLSVPQEKASRGVRIVQIAKPGDILGMSETTSGNSYETTAEILEPSSIGFVSRKQWLTYLRENRAVCLKLVHLLSEDLHRLYQQYRTVGGPGSRVRKMTSGKNVPARHPQRPA